VNRKRRHDQAHPEIREARHAKPATVEEIVNQRQTPWGLIAITAAVAALAVAVIGYAVTRNVAKTNAGRPDAITGIQHYPGLPRNHQAGVLSYPQSPPVGGNHAPIWADCAGTVYPKPIANENAVHSLEHGAVWITYRPGLPTGQMDVLTKLVAGQQYTLLSPYPGLKSAVSLQSWGYQLFLGSATDPHASQFLATLRLNQNTTPELGASCTNPQFKASPSTPGHPVNQ